MNRFVSLAWLWPLAACGALTLAYGAPPANTQKTPSPGNSYYLYTQALRVDESGVVAIPSRYRWSVETSWSGKDLQGNDLPDSRILLRLYDPDQNSSALTAQMDLATAARLHQELGELLVKKLQNASYQQRPQLYDAKLIPTKRIVGVDEKGVAILEEVAPPPETDSPPK